MISHSDYYVVYRVTEGGKALITSTYQHALSLLLHKPIGLCNAHVAKHDQKMATSNVVGLTELLT